MVGKSTYDLGSDQPHSHYIILILKITVIFLQNIHDLLKSVFWVVFNIEQNHTTESTLNAKFLMWKTK